jgi:hypothetical protein
MNTKTHCAPGSGSLGSSRLPIDHLAFIGLSIRHLEEIGIVSRRHAKKRHKRDNDPIVNGYHRPHDQPPRSAGRIIRHS